MSSPVRKLLVAVGIIAALLPSTSSWANCSAPWCAPCADRDPSFSASVCTYDAPGGITYTGSASNPNQPPVKSGCHRTVIDEVPVSACAHVWLGLDDGYRGQTQHRVRRAEGNCIDGNLQLVGQSMVGPNTFSISGPGIYCLTAIANCPADEDRHAGGTATDSDCVEYAPPPGRCDPSSLRLVGPARAEHGDEVTFEVQAGRSEDAEDFTVWWEFALNWRDAPRTSIMADQGQTRQSFRVWNDIESPSIQPVVAKVWGCAPSNYVELRTEIGIGQDLPEPATGARFEESEAAPAGCAVYGYDDYASQPGCAPGDDSGCIGPEEDFLLLPFPGAENSGDFPPCTGLSIVAEDPSIPVRVDALAGEQGGLRVCDGASVGCDQTFVELVGGSEYSLQVDGRRAADDGSGFAREVLRLTNAETGEELDRVTVFMSNVRRVEIPVDQVVEEGAEGEVAVDLEARAATFASIERTLKTHLLDVSFVLGQSVRVGWDLMTDGALNLGYWVGTAHEPELARGALPALVASQPMRLVLIGDPMVPTHPVVGAYTAEDTSLYVPGLNRAARGDMTLVVVEAVRFEGDWLQLTTDEMSVEVVGYDDESGRHRLASPVARAKEEADSGLREGQISWALVEAPRVSTVHEDLLFFDIESFESLPSSQLQVVLINRIYRALGLLPAAPSDNRLHVPDDFVAGHEQMTQLRVREVNTQSRYQTVCTERQFQLPESLGLRTTACQLALSDEVPLDAGPFATAAPRGSLPFGALENVRVGDAKPVYLVACPQPTSAGWWRLDGPTEVRTVEQRRDRQLWRDLDEPGSYEVSVSVNDDDCSAETTASFAVVGVRDLALEEAALVAGREDRRSLQADRAAGRWSVVSTGEGEEDRGFEVRALPSFVASLDEPLITFDVVAQAEPVGASWPEGCPQWRVARVDAAGEVARVLLDEEDADTMVGPRLQRAVPVAQSGGGGELDRFRLEARCGDSVVRYDFELRLEAPDEDGGGGSTEGEAGGGGGCVTHPGGGRLGLFFLLGALIIARQARRRWAEVRIRVRRSDP